MPNDTHFLLRLRRRALYAGLVVITTVAGVTAMLDVLNANTLTVPELITLGLFSLAFALIASSFWNAMLGFLIHWFSRDALAVVAPIANRLAPRLQARTAVVMPVYNEDPAAVMAGFEATFRSLAATGQLNQFEFFLLSDSTDDAIAAQEQARWQALITQLGTQAQGRLHYRRRAQNINRKVGNIDDFCRRWGSRFDFMLVLDADSIMSGTAVVRLARMMQANPNTGIIQTVPQPIRQQTLFGRVLQFGSRLCSELICTGLTYWQLDDGNYYGHNAIIRLQPFIAHCQLPTLPGQGPLSGPILSHDFVEAALMRRAGWTVWTLPLGDGSFEELPSNILDYANRDRRWCQGNLQHLRLLAFPGFKMMSRFHLLMGALGYLASPLWLLLIIFGGIQLLGQALSEPIYFQPDSPFPIWPIDKSMTAIALFVTTVLMLLAPKLLSAVLVLADTRRRTRFGGSGRLLASLGCEAVFTTLQAPILMVFHSYFVIATLSGHTISWNPQPRGSRALRLSEAWRHHQAQFGLGLVLAVGVLAIAPLHGWWMLPVLAGLLLSTPLAILGSSRLFGRGCRYAGLFLAPEEQAADKPGGHGLATVLP